MKDVLVKVKKKEDIDWMLSDVKWGLIRRGITDIRSNKKAKTLTTLSCRINVSDMDDGSYDFVGENTSNVVDYVFVQERN